MSQEEKAFQKGKTLFSGLVFLLSKETPMDALEFVILCADGKVVREYLLSPEQISSTTITHQVVDRSDKQKRFILSREYIQPQWVFDSFNVKALLPTQPYAPGQAPPPHLSPFVLHEGTYVPKQAEVLREWGAIDSPAVLGPKKEEAKEEAPQELDEDEQAETLEKKISNRVSTRTRRNSIFTKRTRKNKTSKKEDEEGNDDEGNDEEEEDDEDDENEESEDEKENKTEENTEKKEKTSKVKKKQGKKEESKPMVKPLSKAAQQLVEEKDLSKLMMPKKAKRLYGRMQYGIKAKQQKEEALIAKRLEIEQEQRTLQKKRKTLSDEKTTTGQTNKKKKKKTQKS